MPLKQQKEHFSLCSHYYFYDMKDGVKKNYERKKLLSLCVNELIKSYLSALVEKFHWRDGSNFHE